MIRALVYLMISLAAGYQIMSLADGALRYQDQVCQEGC